MSKESIGERAKRFLDTIDIGTIIAGGGLIFFAPHVSGLVGTTIAALKLLGANMAIFGGVSLGVTSAAWPSEKQASYT